MLRFILRKSLAGLFVIWGIITLVFFIFNLLGDPVEMMVSENADEATRSEIRRAHRLDQPVWKQYLWYLNDVSPIGFVLTADAEAMQSCAVLFHADDYHSFGFKWPDLRRSIITRQKVGSILLQKLPGTLILTVAAMLFAIIAGVWLGVAAGMKPGSWRDRIISFLAMLGTSAPSFLVAVILIRIFAVSLRHFTGLNVTGYLFEEEIFGEGTVIHWRNLILPALALGIRPLSVFVQLTRASIMEVMSADYIRTARAKGLAERAILIKHALRNALNPVVTSVSSWFASLLAGAFFVEFMFDWEGLGKMTIDALNNNDYPVVLGATVFIGVTFVITNFLVDILYTRLDPRIRLAA